MARPIKDTPILHDEDARRFERQIKENQNKIVTEDEYAKTKAAFDKFSVVLNDQG